MSGNKVGNIHLTHFTHRHADSVILIHNGHYAERQQFRKRVLGIQIALSLITTEGKRSVFFHLRVHLHR